MTVKAKRPGRRLQEARNLSKFSYDYERVHCNNKEPGVFGVSGLLLISDFRLVTNGFLNTAQGQREHTYQETMTARDPHLF